MSILRAGLICLWLEALLCCKSDALAQPVAVEPKVLQRLQETIQQQQQQLARQAEQIKAQAELLRQLEQQVGTLQSQSQAQLSSAAVTVKAEPAPVPPAEMTSGNDKISLALSGHINRAVNVVNDGGRTSLYHVDNNADNTRIRLVGTARISEEFTLGSWLEFVMTADDSSLVSQNSQAPGNYISTKGAELSLSSKRFGKLSLGKGSTASDNTSAADLSRTDIVLYSSIADIAGGILFKQKNGLLSSTSLATAFDPLDGLGDTSRLRYDSPALFGFVLSGSLASGQRSDLALTWDGEGYGFQASAAFGLANPKLSGAALQYDGSFSLLHTASGLNLTLAGGLLDRTTGSDATAAYAKLGWLANLIRQGATAFGVDYAQSRDMAALGDTGRSMGGAVVQAFDRYATELYLQYRLFSLDRSAAPSVFNVNVSTFGARVKF